MAQQGLKAVSLALTKQSSLPLGDANGQSSSSQFPPGDGLLEYTKRRATMNSRAAYDEEEMLRRAIEESKAEEDMIDYSDEELQVDASESGTDLKPGSGLETEDDVPIPQPIERERKPYVALPGSGKTYDIEDELPVPMTSDKDATSPESEITTNPSIIQGPIAGDQHGSRDHWPYGATPPPADLSDYKGLGTAEMKPNLTFGDRASERRLSPDYQYVPGPRLDGNDKDSDSKPVLRFEMLQNLDDLMTHLTTITKEETAQLSAAMKYWDTLQDMSVKDVSG